MFSLITKNTIDSKIFSFTQWRKSMNKSTTTDKKSTTLTFPSKDYPIHHKSHKLSSNNHKIYYKASKIATKDKTGTIWNFYIPYFAVKQQKLSHFTPSNRQSVCISSTTSNKYTITALWNNVRSSTKMYNT